MAHDKILKKKQNKGNLFRAKPSTRSFWTAHRQPPKQASTHRGHQWWRPWRGGGRKVCPHFLNISCWLSETFLTADVFCDWNSFEGFWIQPCRRWQFDYIALGPGRENPTRPSNKHVICFNQQCKINNAKVIMIDPVPDLYIGFHAFAENLVSTNIHTGTELRAAFQMFDFGTRRSHRLVQWKSLATFMTLSHLTSMPSVDESTLTVTNCVTYSVSIKLKENWCICHHFYSGSQQIFRLSAKTKKEQNKKRFWNDRFQVCKPTQSTLHNCPPSQHQSTHHKVAADRGLAALRNSRQVDKTRSC